MTLVTNRGHVDANVEEQLLKFEEYSDEESEFWAIPSSNSDSGILKYGTSIDDAASKILVRHEGQPMPGQPNEPFRRSSRDPSEHNGELGIKLEKLPNPPQVSILRRRRLISLFHDLIAHKPCFPGAVTASGNWQVRLKTALVRSIINRNGNVLRYCY